MKPKVLLLAACLSLICLGQSTLPTESQIAKNATCSNTKIDAKGNVTFICSGISSEQVKLLQNMQAVLNALLKSEQSNALRIAQKLDKVLANQDNVNSLMEKLDQLLSDLNPNKPIKSYFCDGEWRQVGPSASAAVMIETGGDDRAFKEMAVLNNTRRYGALLERCQVEIKSNPEWLTPYLFCSLASLALGKTEDASHMLSYFDKNSGPAYDADACKHISTYLHAQLDSQH